MSEEDEQHNESFRDSIATVDKEGKRIWIFPKLQKGKFFKKRAIVAYSLLAVLVIMPFIKISGQPLLMLNIIERKFSIFGKVFWPQDLFIFALAMITGVIIIIVFTVVFGRLFCGWACPQTIFMEMIFRRIEYWIDGDWTHQKKLDNMPWNAYKIRKRALKWGIFWIISFLISNLFLSYIIGVDELKKIIVDNPANHLGGLTAIIIFTTVFFAVFAWFREQVCTTVCPYGRLQGVLLDRNSIVVAYDKVRGEKRAKFKKNENREETGKGDCIDCHQCVNVCPTGIDIRNGTQLECINCTLCMDACDSMMNKVGLEEGLIRYDSEEGITTGKPWQFTTRIKAYVILMILALGVMGTLIFTRSDVYATIIRLRGTTYQKLNDSTYTNIYNVDLANKTLDQLDITLDVIEGDAEIEVIGDKKILLEESSTLKREIIVRMKKADLTGPKTPLVIGVYADGELIDEEDVTFSGPGF